VVSQVPEPCERVAFSGQDATNSKAPGGSGLALAGLFGPRHLEKIDRDQHQSQKETDCLHHSPATSVVYWQLLVKPSHRHKIKGSRSSLILTTVLLRRLCVFLHWPLSCAFANRYCTCCRQFPVLQNSFSALACFSYSIRHAHLNHSYPRTLSLILPYPFFLSVVNFCSSCRYLLTI